MGALLACVACGKDDDGIANYYLSGRVLDGSTLEPIAGVEVKVVAGSETKKEESAGDGSFLIGPISPASGYRVAAEAQGFDAFAFYGTPLPTLHTRSDSTIAGDVVLYPVAGQSPEFRINVASRDARLPLDPALSEARFTPRRLGHDPAEMLTGLSADAGAYNPASDDDLGGTFLPNHALSGVVGHRVALTNGQAVVPAGALRWGAGYSLEIYGGPAFEPQNVLLDAGRPEDVNIWLSPSEHTAGTDLPTNVAQYFAGRIYDGVSLERLTNYSIRLEYFDRVIAGTVDASGRYFIGPLLANADYSVVVQSEGYRSFLSHNERLDASALTELTALYYDAFLYPQGVTTPGATCRVRLSDSTDLPSGFMRFTPSSASSLMDEDGELPVGVVSGDSGRQLWYNDEDLQQRSLVVPFQNGEVVLENGQLVYGVTYAVTIYGVEGHGAVTDAFVAGVDGDRSWVLAPLPQAGLAVAAMSNDTLELSADGTLDIRFNQPVALAPSLDAAAMLRTLNDAFVIDDNDDDDDGNLNVLVDAADVTPPVPAAYRGVTLTIEGDLLRLRWDRAAGLASVEAEDRINFLTYAALDAVVLYAPTARTPVTADLATLLGTSSSSVQLAPPAF